MKQLKEVDEPDFPCESKSQLSQIPLTHRFSPLNLFQVIYHTNAFAEKPSALCLFLNTSLFLFYSLCSRLSSWSQLLLPQQDNLRSSLCACVCVCVCLWAFEGIRHPYHTLHSSRVWAAALGHASALLPQKPNTHTHMLEKSSFLFRDSSHMRPQKKAIWRIHN